LTSGHGTGGILPSGMGFPSSDDQASSKGYVDSVRNKASTGTAYVDPVAGDDVTGRIQKSSLPFKTIQAAIDACAVVATSNNRYLVYCSIGTYNEDVTMKDFVGVRGNDIEATIINGQVTFPPAMVDVTGVELTLVSIISSNEPAVVVSLGANEAYCAFRSCALYTYWTADVAVKPVIQVSRGTFENYGTTWIEGSTLTGNGSTGVSCLYYGTTNALNMGTYHITDYTGTHRMNVEDVNDTVSPYYSDAAQASVMEMIACQTRIYMDSTTNHVNKVKVGFMNGGDGIMDIKSGLATVMLHVTNEVDVIMASNENAPSYRTGGGVHFSGARVRIPNLIEGHAFIGSAPTANDYVETFYCALAPQRPVYPQRYTADGVLGKVGFVLAHGEGDLLIGGGLDISADNPSSVTPASGHGRLYLQTSSGFERPYFMDSRGNSVRIGRDTVWTIYNAEATPLVRGELVYLVDGLNSGSTTYAKRAIATNVNTCAFGVVSDVNGIASGARGMIIRLGRVESGVVTSTYAQNAKLYLSDTVAGAFTNVAPAGISQLIGSVQTVSTNGSIVVGIQAPDFLSSKVDTVNSTSLSLNLTSQTITNFTSASTVFNTPNIIRGRLYVANTNALPFSKTVTLTFNTQATPASGTEIWQADMLMSAVLTSGSLAVGATNVVVADASDFSANALVYITGSTNEFVRIKSVNGNNLIFKYPCTASHTASNLCSRVREFGGFKTYDSTGSKAIFNSIEFATATSIGLKMDLEYSQ
jgi:hypothetical protein